MEFGYWNVKADQNRHASKSLSKDTMLIVSSFQTTIEDLMVHVFGR